MTILSNLLRILTQSSQTPSDVELEHGRSKRTEQVIEQYDQLLNANHASRRRRPIRPARAT
jgi:hypothetical protein